MKKGCVWARENGRGSARRRRILSVLLALAQVLSMAPAVSVRADGVTMAGAGSADNPYQITSYVQLKEFAVLVNGGQTRICAVLMNDITATDDTWTPIGQDIQNEFAGVFDGNGKTIVKLSNAGVSDVPQYSGLFGQTRGTVKNLVLKEFSFRASISCGAVTGENDGTVDSCICSDSAAYVSSAFSAGGIAGVNNSNIFNCRNTCKVTGDLYVGGIAGYFPSGRIQYCRNTGEVSGESFVGGIAGFSLDNAFIQSCINTGKVTASSEGAGGICGLLYGTIKNCCNTGEVSGHSYVGGVLGENYKNNENFPCLVKNCFNIGALWGTRYVGGVVGQNGESAESSSTGEMVWLSGTVEGCYWMEGTAPDGVGFDENSDWKATKLTAAQFKQVSSFSDLDFTDTWYMGPDMPLLYFYEEIGSASDWNWLAAYLIEGVDTAGWRVSQTADISVTDMIGSDAYRFRGSYDGRGHKLTFNDSDAPQGCAPFKNIEDASIRNLLVDGTIITENKFAAGLASAAYGTCEITNCRSGVDIESKLSGDGTHGGLLAVCADNSIVTITGCVFDGTINGKYDGGATTSCGGIVGFTRKTGVKLTVRDTVLAAQKLDCGSSQNFTRYYSDAPDSYSLENCYYFGQTFNNAQGKKGRKVSAGTDVSLALAGEATTYSVSGITVVEGKDGLSFDGSFYAAEGETLSLIPQYTGTAAEAEDFFTATAGGLTHEGSTYTLKMPDEDVTINVGKHDWGEPEYKWDDDWKTATATRVCKYNTDHKETEKVNTTSNVTLAPTCTQWGKTTYTATFQSPAFKQQSVTREDVAPLGHDYQLTGWSWTGYTAAQAVFTCTRGDDTKYVEAEVKSQRSEPTSEQDGKIVYTASVTFENKPYSNEKTEIIPALDPAYELSKWEWEDYESAKATFTDKNGGKPLTVEALIQIERTEPKCETAGKIIYTAIAKLGEDTFTDEKTVTIDPLEHDLVEHPAQAANCTEAGWTAYEACTRCEYTTCQEIPALGHDYQLTGWDWEDYEAAEAVFTCTRCGDVQHVSAAVTSERTEPTAEAAGRVVYTAEAVFGEKTYTDEKTESIPALRSQCTVVFKDEDGTVLQSVKVAYGQTPAYTGKTPAKAADGKYTYTFAGWTPEITAATGDTAYTAVYKSSPVQMPFVDVKKGAFYYDSVLWAVYHEPQITNGMDKSHFGPEVGCTRGQVVTFLWRTAGCPEPKNMKTSFADVGEKAFYAKAVAWAVEEGITKGMSETSFAPDATCTRGQIVTFLWRFKGQEKPGSGKTPFTDVSAGAFYAKAVAWAVEQGVTKGMTKETFAPDATCTRGQIVTFLYRATEGK